MFQASLNAALLRVSRLGAVGSGKCVQLCVLHFQNLFSLFLLLLHLFLKIARHTSDVRGLNPTLFLDDLVYNGLP